MTELKHHGIPGQKWGVRRFQNPDGTLTAAGKKKKSLKYHEDYTNAHTKKHVNQMSDDELRSRLNRLQMEQNYNKITDSDKSRGKEFINNVVKTSTTVAAFTGSLLTIYNNIEKIKKIL